MNSTKLSLVVLFMALFLLGCSQKQGAGGVDVIQPGQEITWADGSVMTVAKRDGNAVEGVRIVRTFSSGQATVITADKGAVERGTDRNSVAVTLYEARTQTGNNEMTARLLRLVFTK